MYKKKREKNNKTKLGLLEIKRSGLIPSISMFVRGMLGNCNSEMCAYALYFDKSCHLPASMNGVSVSGEKDLPAVCYLT